MHRTLGDLVDALVTTNIKLFLAQDRLQKAADEERDLEAATVQQIAKLNRQRNRLMTGLDSTLDRAVKEKAADVDSRPKV